MLHPDLLTAAQSIHLTPADLLPYGRDKAKVDLAVLARARTSGRLVLVSAITPTAAGEGKTTTSIGLAQGLARIGQSVCLALRQPSLGPCLGMKGGATGGGASSLIPTEDINLHFTGDFHAITTAHNLLAALIDNHLHFRHAPRLDPSRILWPRVMDMNDRTLRKIVLGLGGKANGTTREGSFDITAASEVMAILCLSQDHEDLRTRLSRILVGFSEDGKPVTAGDIGAPGAMVALLKDAMLPNLVRTTEGVPALVHGGPFANIAHGCNSVVATRMAMHCADWAVTEAGFGFDLGAEKFFDIKARSAGLDTAAVVLVATVRALRLHGGGKSDGPPDTAAVLAGLPNLGKHLESIRTFGERPIVAINRFGADSEAEIAIIRDYCTAQGVPCALSDHFGHGGEGARALAELVVEHAERESVPYKPLYPLDMKPADKVRAVARQMYGARDVVLTKEATRDLAEVRSLGLEGLPVCIAKVPGSLSDDPTRRGRPEGFDITIRRVHVNAGAGFLVVVTGEVMRMPGLPEHPLALDIDYRDGKIIGLR